MVDVISAFAYIKDSRETSIGFILGRRRFKNSISCWSVYLFCKYSTRLQGKEHVKILSDPEQVLIEHLLATVLLNMFLGGFLVYYSSLVMIIFIVINSIPIIGIVIQNISLGCVWEGVSFKTPILFSQTTIIWSVQNFKWD